MNKMSIEEVKKEIRKLLVGLSMSEIDTLLFELKMEIRNETAYCLPTA